ncbi:MAG: hypothetical protein M0Z69_05255, partial [Actinomycetota bacterium]|nr:hypothetical protein [Actinomycetota bacterium]
MTRVVLFAPLGGTPTGGVEALYQLTDAVRRAGGEAFLTSPDDPVDLCSVPECYSMYDAPRISRGDVRADDVLVIPEIWLCRPEVRTHPRVVVWWLSVDNAFSLPRISRFSPARAVLRYPRKLARAVYKAYGARDILARKVRPLHATQSYYAASFLERHGIASVMLTDYLPDAFHEPQTDDEQEPRPYAVAYNPAKGAEYVRALIGSSDGRLFVPLAGLDRVAVARTLAQCDIYLDLGHHPGRDRIPREAALSGCVVIVANRGAAANDVDVPLAPQYKVDLPR